MIRSNATRNTTHRFPLSATGASLWTLITLLFLLASVGAILSWLFIQVDAVNGPDYKQYGDKLRALRQTNAELNLAVLTNKLDLELDSANILKSLDKLDSVSANLLDLPQFLFNEDRKSIFKHAIALDQLHAYKRQQIELFIAEQTKVRNASARLATATEALIDEPILSDQHYKPIFTLSHHLLAGAGYRDTSLDSDLHLRLQTLFEQLENLPTLDERLIHALLEAKTLLESKLTLDRLTREIVTIPTVSYGDELAQSYIKGRQRAMERVRNYQMVLYALALILAAYLVLAMLRLSRTSQALKKANRDLQERVDTLRRTQRDLRLFATVFTNASEGMTITDGEEHIIAVNPAFSRITGYAREDVLGQTPAALKSGRHDDSFYREMWASLHHSDQWQGEIWNRRKNGEVYPEWLSISSVRREGENPTHYIGIFSDLSDRKAAEARILHLSHHDALTNLPNRILLQDRIRQVILQSRHNQRLVAILFINLDRFKPINDTLGHEVGDALLVQLAQRCLDVVTEIDTVSRYGSDELIIILPELETVQEAATTARTLLDRLGEPYQLQHHELTVTASIGIAVYPQDGEDASVLLRNADAAMRAVKADSRNSYRFYSADTNATSLDELLLEHQLRHSIERNEMCLHFQPKVCTQSGRILGVEALIRWQHPQLGLLPPARFIPAAEASGQIVQIDEWVLRTACQQLRDWADAGHPSLSIAVNLSAKQFVQQDLVGLIRSTLDESGIAANQLELELTETMLMSNVERTIDTLSQLRELGVRLSIDDFGTGYSSLAYLQLFEVDILKIDSRFMAGILDEDSQGRIAAAIIALAHSLDQQVTAEGVETEYQRDFLVRHHCDTIQGYLFSPPIPAQAFSELLAKEATKLATSPVTAPSLTSRAPSG